MFLNVNKIKAYKLLFVLYTLEVLNFANKKITQLYFSFIFHVVKDLQSFKHDNEKVI